MTKYIICMMPVPPPTPIPPPLNTQWDPTHRDTSINNMLTTLTLYPMIAPFDAFEILCIRKYHGKSRICSIGANAPFAIIFSKVIKT